MLILGIRGRHTEIVTMEKAASSLGSGGLDVYGTPAMIALMEGTALYSVQPYLDPGMTTVGTLVNIQHKAATPIGSIVTCESELIEIDRKRLVFHVVVSDENGEIGSGLHERFIVNIDRFLEKVKQRK
ncbi:MAG: thioesterase family protein [Flexilinea flocculi]|jgi:predicted thioesterase|nr:thioesterase family protein [Flexilinea flocculi]